MNPSYDHIETNASWGKLYRKELIGTIRCGRNMVMSEDFKFNFNYIIRNELDFLNAVNGSRGKNESGKYLDYIQYKCFEHNDSISRSYKPVTIRTIDGIKRMVQENANTSV